MADKSTMSEGSLALTLSIPNEIFNTFLPTEGIDLDALSKIRLGIGEKAAGCAALLKLLDRQEKIIKASVKALRAYLADGMSRAKIQNAGTDDHRLSLIHVLDVEVTDQAQVPVEFIVEVPATVKVDKKAIQKHVKLTGEQPTGTLVTPRVYIRVK